MPLASTRTSASSVAPRTGSGFSSTRTSPGAWNVTARDSYRKPVSSFEAIQELRRVAGKQLDARFVEVFIELLEGEDVSFRHGEEADFERELALEARIAETASPGVNAGRFQVAGVSVG